MVVLFPVIPSDQYKAAYPEAKLMAPADAIENVKKSGKDLAFDGGASMAAMIRVSSAHRRAGRSLGARSPGHQVRV